jgi:thiol-disulfide isomerase/thioredoxin
VRLLTRIGRRIAARVASVVEQDELFEKPGERPRAAPLPPSSGQRPSAAAAGVPGDRAGSAPPAVAQPVPADGRCRAVGLEELRRALGSGGGVRLVNHWATWCEPCIDELPALRALAAALPTSVTVVGVSWDLFESGGSSGSVAGAVASFSALHDMTWTSLLVDCEPDAFFGAFDLGSQKIPQTWIVSDAGDVIWRWEGLLDQDAIDAVHEQLRRLADASA